jgi:phage-related protein
MQRVRDDPRSARHLAGELYEVRAARAGQAHRVTFVREGRRKQVLLAVDAFAKTTQRTPADRVRVGLERAREWRARGLSPRGVSARGAAAREPLVRSLERQR